MSDSKEPKFDEIGYWSEVKLNIIKKYAQAYSTIFSARSQARFHHVYIDAFAGPGIHKLKGTDEFVPGSPLNALCVVPRFREFHFIDLDGNKLAYLRSIVGSRPDVHLYHGDCNSILLQRVFPLVKYSDFRRGLCLLDPYGLHLAWDVIRRAGQMKTIDMFLNFPIMDMNRNTLWRHPEQVNSSYIERMNAYWGDGSWRQAAYMSRPSLWGDVVDEKADNETIAAAFRRRLSEVAGFQHVAEPLPMRNTKGAVVYYLFFASQSSVGYDIVHDIFADYRNYGVRQ